MRERKKQLLALPSVLCSESCLQNPLFPLSRKQVRNRSQVPRLEPGFLFLKQGWVLTQQVRLTPCLLPGRGRKIYFSTLHSREIGLVLQEILTRQIIDTVERGKGIKSSSRVTFQLIAVILTVPAPSPK